MTDMLAKEKLSVAFTDSFTDKFTDKFTDARPELLPALTLAYIGDGYYELVVRNLLLKTGRRKVEELHKAAISLVCAATQAHLARRLEPELTEQERSVLHRGRNTRGLHVPKGATVQDYRAATGMEALVGFWYLRGEHQRLERCFEVLYTLWEAEHHA